MKFKFLKKAVAFFTAAVMAMGTLAVLPRFGIVANAANSSFPQIFAGGNNSAAIDENGYLYVWGDNSEKQILGRLEKNINNPFYYTDEQLNIHYLWGNIKKISFGFGWSAILDNEGHLYTFGDDYLGQRGNGENDFTNWLVLNNVKDVYMGKNHHSAAITNDGDLYTWGGNYGGGLGNGTYASCDLPNKIMSEASAVSLGGSHSASIKTNGDLYTWGDNGQGQLGNGTGGIGNTSNIPQKIMSNIAYVELGYVHSAAITTNGDLYTWGFNKHGELGNGTTTNSNVPIKIMENVASISMGYYHSAAITTNGDLYVWGYNNHGQLGDGTSIDRLTPTKIMSDVCSVSLGQYHSIALKKNGEIYTWGWNQDGQLGNGTYIDSNVPIKLELVLSGDNENTPLTTEQKTQMTKFINQHINSSMFYSFYLKDNDNHGKEVLKTMQAYDENKQTEIAAAMTEFLKGTVNTVTLDFKGVQSQISFNPYNAILLDMYFDLEMNSDEFVQQVYDEAIQSEIKKNTSDLITVIKKTCSAETDFENFKLNAFYDDMKDYEEGKYEDLTVIDLLQKNGMTLKAGKSESDIEIKLISTPISDCLGSTNKILSGIGTCNEFVSNIREIICASTLVNMNDTYRNILIEIRSRAFEIEGHEWEKTDLINALNYEIDYRKYYCENITFEVGVAAYKLVTSLDGFKEFGANKLAQQLWKEPAEEFIKTVFKTSADAVLLKISAIQLGVDIGWKLTESMFGLSETSNLYYTGKAYGVLEEILIDMTDEAALINNMNTDKLYYDINDNEYEISSMYKKALTFDYLFRMYSYIESNGCKNYANYEKSFLIDDESWFKAAAQTAGKVIEANVRAVINGFNFEDAIDDMERIKAMREFNKQYYQNRADFAKKYYVCHGKYFAEGTNPADYAKIVSANYLSMYRDEIDLLIGDYSDAPNISITTSGSAVYDGAAIENRVDFAINTSGNNGEIIFWYATKGSEEFLPGLPSQIGSYTIKVEVAADHEKRYKRSFKAFEFRITETTVYKSEPTIVSGLVYDGKVHQLVTSGEVVEGEIQYSLDNISYSTSIPTGINAGVYTVYYKVVGSSINNSSAVKSVNATISKADPIVTPPIAKNGLYYTGKSQQLITAGATSGGSMEYSLDGENWSLAIPTGIEAKTYTVYYKVVGDTNYNSTEYGQITVLIEKRDEVITEIVVNNTNLSISYGYEGLTDSIRTETVEFDDVTVEMVEWMYSHDKSYTLLIDFVNAFTALSSSDNIILTEAQIKAIEYVLAHDYGD